MPFFILYPDSLERMVEAEIELELPDGSRIRVPQGTTPLEVAQRIGPRLVREALAGKLEGVWVDLRAPLREGGRFRIITTRDPEGGEVIRHSAEHVMADAVKRLWLGVQIDVGRTDHSEKFQYDFDTPTPLRPEDLERIEAEMRRIIEAGEPFRREVVTHEKARRLFAKMGEHLKVSRIDDIPEGEEVTLFRHGDFVDLCRGPHVQDTRQIGAFKLTEIAGSYWRSDEGNKMLQRIYGIAFATMEELEQHLRLLEEVKRRDHRRLGKELDLFSFHPIAPGSPFFHPKGAFIYNRLIAYMRSLYQRYGYAEVISPQIFDVELWHRSGHYENYKENMFFIEIEGREFGVKPMNCPGHTYFYTAKRRSYRELPLRYADFARLHRFERSGVLSGLTRVRSFSQDDAHIFCTPEQIEAEVTAVLRLMQEVYRTLGFHEMQVQLSTRPPKRLGDDATWERAEAALAAALTANGIEYAVNPGEGAFYGPKIDFVILDVLKREWQLGTIQLDYSMPERFDLSYVTPQGDEARPVMIHRAVLGSLERFMGILIEHCGGDFPLWLAPVQVRILTIAERQQAYAREVYEQMLTAGLRPELDVRNEKLSYKIRE
ncbi:MAG: threonine--tRNA ligase, partial [Deltaproteobacteria bacterium]|nr:threonine--tRNA ligase [Deltaproteobacteria bacterium]